MVDLHAITVPQDPKKLKMGVNNAVAAYLAAGIDPEKSKVFVQVRLAFATFGLGLVLLLPLLLILLYRYDKRCLLFLT